MRLKGFQAKSVFGYLDIYVEFNKDLTFLTGGNGCGKTTALKLIHSILTMDIKELTSIPFEYLNLTLEHNNKDYEVSAVTNKDVIKLSISNINEPLEIPLNIPNEMHFASNKRIHASEYYQEAIMGEVNHPVIKKLSDLPSPTFLGLDRRNESGISDYATERDRIYSRTSNSMKKKSKALKGNLGMSLMETELRIQDSYRRMRRFEEKQSVKLRDSILLSAFTYSEFNPEEAVIPRDMIENSAQLLSRRREINEALSNIGVSDSKLSEQVNDFFDRLDRLLTSVKHDDDTKINIEWLTNKAQIERITSLVEIIDEHKSRVDKYFAPINTFLDKVNLFFKDTNKKLIVDTVGHVHVARPNGNLCSIEGLSSGERQIVIILAHAIFKRHQGKNSIFIIDEPELSLHMKWQEIFIHEVEQISPETQFIMATHSPDIVGNNRGKCQPLKRGSNHVT